MSAAAANATDAPAPAKGKKKLILIVAALVLVLVLGGGGVAAMLMMKKNAAADADGEDGPAAAPVKAQLAPDPKAVPTFVPMDPFTVNLADRDAERYAQVGLTLEIDDAKTGARIKAFLPAIRNNILMAIGDRTAGELLSRDGKTKLAEKIRLETARALGYEVPNDNEVAATAGEEADSKASKKKKEEKKPAPVVLPVKAVHFSNFIIQ